MGIKVYKLLYERFVYIMVLLGGNDYGYKCKEFRRYKAGGA